MTKTKYPDNSPRWKWLEERGFRIMADPVQLAYMKSLFATPNEVRSVFCDSKAGTGKTTLAVLAGAYEVMAGSYERIIYIRNAVPVREQGFLKGGLKEKEAPYMQPLADAMEYVQPFLYEEWTNEEGDEAPKLATLTTSFARGVNWKNAFVIVDEAQSFDLEELQAALTRPHDNCKVVVIGSTRQIDNKKLKRIAGLTPFEVYMAHFAQEGLPFTTHFHTLEKNYRGDFAEHADNIGDTVKALVEGSVVQPTETNEGGIV